MTFFTSFSASKKSPFDGVFKALRRVVTLFPLRHAVTLLLPYCLLLAAAPAKAAITNAFLSTYLINGETVNTTSTTVTFAVTGAASNVEIDIFRLENISDIPSEENQVAAIQQNGMAAGTHTIGWSALWLIGNDVGRMNGNYQVIVTANDGSNDSSFVIPTLLQITSVDIHDVSVRASTDAASNPSLPYNIRYALAKASIVTIRVLDSTGTVVRTLLQEAPQLGEDLQINRLQWNGLGDDGKPVPLGIYTLTFDAKDSGSTDVATQRTRTAAIFSLASLGSGLDQLFRDNVIVFPNPIRTGSATFQFLAVRNNANITLKIYTLAGDLVRDETFPNQSTGNTSTFVWDTTNESGNAVGRGIYYYTVREEDPEGTLQATKKLAVIR